MSRLFHTALAAVISTLLLACGEKNNPEGDLPSDTPVQATPGQVSYSQTIKPLLDQFCNICHSATGTSPALDSYTDAVKSAKASNEAIQSARMPLGGATLSEVQKQAFQDWVDQGTPND
jgi:hypothetical protein